MASSTNRLFTTFDYIAKMAAVLFVDSEKTTEIESDLKVLFKDEHFIVVDKNPDLVVNWSNPLRPSLHKQLCKRFPDKVNPNLKYGFYFPHRLDYATSGVMCVALTKEACAVASQSFQKHTSIKNYIALVWGTVSAAVSEIDIPVGETVNEASRMAANGVNARPATTRLLVLDYGRYGSRPATKILLRPLTGRRHQLRVHCHAIGHTIIGDFTYSNREDVDPPRMFLHALRLCLPNPLNTIDLATEDPFDDIQDWVVLKRVNPLLTEILQTL